MHSLKFLGENKTLKGTNMHFLYLFIYFCRRTKAGTIALALNSLRAPGVKMTPQPVITL